MLHVQIPPLRFPQDILRFLYWALFKPITFDKYLHQIEPKLGKAIGAGTNLRILFRYRGKHPEFLAVVQLALFNIFFIPLLAFPLAWLLNLTGFEVTWTVVTFAVIAGIVGGVALGVIVDGVVAVAFSMAISVVFVVVLSVAESVASIVAGNIPIQVVVASGVAFGLAFAVAVGVALLSFGPIRMVLVIWGIVAIEIATCVMSGIAIGSIFGVMAGLVGGVAVGVAFAVAVIISYFRLPLWFLQTLWSFIHNRMYKEGGLAGSPILYDELIWFPLFGLDGLLVQIAKEDRSQGMEAIAFVASSFRQGWAAKRALLELTTYDVSNACELNSISGISSSLSWLPNDARMDMQDLLLGLEQTSQHGRAALESETLYNKQEQLRMGMNVIERMQGGLALAQNSDMARKMIPALEGWKSVFTQELAGISGKEQIPNVYHSGTPLIKESKTFKGRKDLFRSLSNELINPSGQRPALLLFGARRMGKSSTLKQLPVQLGPQIIPATLDLQSLSAVETASSLLYLIAREVTRSARQERRLSLPELNREQLGGDPYLVFQEWLTQVEKKLGDYYWVLLAFDEFESLGEMLNSERIDERIFQMLRGVMQNHPRITVLMSGAHTLEELPPFWSNYLINTKMLKVNPLEEVDARELITRPIEDFPMTYDEDAVQLLLSETGCHPNWLQFACREVVEKLNEEDRFHANLADVESALSKVPQVLAGDFKDMWEGRDSSDLMRSILRAIALSKSEMLEENQLKKLAKQEKEFQKTLDFLLRRDILAMGNDAFHFRARLLHRWVANQS